MKLGVFALTAALVVTMLSAQVATTTDPSAATKPSKPNALIIVVDVITLSSQDICVGITPYARRPEGNFAPRQSRRESRRHPPYDYPVG